MTSATPTNLDVFADLADQDGADVKATLLRVLTDFYIQKSPHTAEEEKHFSELALRLVDDVDLEARHEFAIRLARYGAAPRAVTNRLAREFSDVADRLMTPAAFGGAGEAFMSGDAATRRKILTELASAGPAVRPLPAPMTADAVRTLEMAALNGRPYDFIREIERTLQVARACADWVVTDTSGEPIVVVAKALDMPLDVLQRVLLLVNPAIGTSVRRVFDLCALYDQISREAALRLVALWRPLPALREHQPATWPEQTGHSRNSAEHSAREAPMPGVRRDQRAS